MQSQGFPHRIYTLHSPVFILGTTCAEGQYFSKGRPNIFNDKETTVKTDYYTHYFKTKH